MAKLSPKRFRGGILLFCKLIIVGMTVGSFYYLIKNYYPETDFWYKGYLVFLFLYLVVFLLFSTTYHCFEIGTARSRTLLFSFVLASFLTNFVFYFILSLTAKMLLNLGPISVLTAIQWALAIVLYFCSDRLYYFLYPVRKSAAVLSVSERELPTIQKIGSMKERHEICLILNESEDVAAIKRKLEPYSTVFVGEIDRALRLELTEYCFETNKRLFVMPSVEDIIFHSARQTFIGDSLVYRCRNRAFSFEEMIVKRLMDVFVSLVGIVLTSPVMLLSALIIKLQDGGPVLFRQERYTRNLTRFTLLKFRSMIVDAEANGAQFTKPGDKRITPYGRFIRSTRIDELPQFFNILRGEMSLVGPRAERIENVDYYCELMPEFRYRMKVKAGLTGYAQIYGKYNTSYIDKLKLDMLYIENCSIQHDLQLLFMTIKVIFLPESTEGFDITTLAELRPNDSESNDGKPPRA